MGGGNTCTQLRTVPQRSHRDCRSMARANREAPYERHRFLSCPIRPRSSMASLNIPALEDLLIGSRLESSDSGIESFFGTRATRDVGSVPKKPRVLGHGTPRALVFLGLVDHGFRLPATPHVCVTHSRWRRAATGAPNQDGSMGEGGRPSSRPARSRASSSTRIPCRS